jgi:hypothetical protein
MLSQSRMLTESNPMMLSSPRRFVFEIGLLYHVIFMGQSPLQRDEMPKIRSSALFWGYFSHRLLRLKT